MVGGMDLFRLGLGVISIWGGVSALNRGLSHLGAGLGRANGGSQTKVIKRRKRTLPTIHRGRHVQTSAGPVRVTLKSVGSLDDRLEAIMENAEKGKFDPEVIAWARKELTKKCGGGWNGEQWCVKEKDTEAEILAIFKALRRDVRYTSDILGADTYMHPRITKKTMSADCLPGDTLLVTPQGLRRIDEMRPGELIHDGSSWTPVLHWWDKGELPVSHFKLNNRNVLRCTDDHRLFCVTRAASGEHVELRAAEVQEGDLLLQPRQFDAGVEHLDPDHALILGAYLAEGWWDENKSAFCIAGVPEGKGLRERVLAAAERLGVRDQLYVHPRYIGFRKEHAWLVAGCGKEGAAFKRLPHLNFDLDTVRVIVGAMEAGDGGYATNGVNMVYSTASRELAFQYRVLKRMLGHSTSLKCMTAEEHGGAGSLPLWRITVRSTHQKRPWAKVKEVRRAAETRRVYDIETGSGRIYLPETDLVVHNCDDFSAFGCAALMSVGIPCRFKVIQTKNSSTPDHIFIQAGTPKDGPRKWIPLDASVPMPPGWEAPKHMVSKEWIYEF